MSATTPLARATVLGYPRLGRRRELKRAIEQYWHGAASRTELVETARELRAATRTRLRELGLSASGGGIPESFSLYDHILDATVLLGAIPERFTDLVGDPRVSDLDVYFALARGDESHRPLEMTKWFDTNYHYSVPEIGAETSFRVNAAPLLEQVCEAREAGIDSRPVLVGPVTFLLLAKAAEGEDAGFSPIDRLEDVVAAYTELLAALHAEGVNWVELDEPALVSDSLSIPRETITGLVVRSFERLGKLSERPAILLGTPYGDASRALPTLAGLPIDALHVDLVRGSLPTGDDFERFRTALGDTQLVAGVVNGRNVWRTKLREAHEQLAALAKAGISVSVGTSTSLLHVPHDVEDETKLDERIASWLAFADQKVQETVTLARGLEEGSQAIDKELSASDAQLRDRAEAPGVHAASVRSRTAAVAPEHLVRAPEAERREAQRALGLPAFPTTTIGSFPQTSDIRRARAAHGRGELHADDYEAFLKAEIERVIRLQEEIGLDVLVHGEAERNDMVQYFAEHLDGFVVTEHGWVQSYGTRATRPSILWGDVSRPHPITVNWSAFAQSLTSHPVKGMLTGPVTILAWSFVRDDEPIDEVAKQVALALRDEIDDLVAAGLRIVQVDEPALRELLPLDEAAQPDYLEWSVNAFRLATSGAASDIQIHTHLCYSEFAEVIEAIDSLGADVTSIEAARSRMDVVEPIAEHEYSRGIGPGIYDIHSPRVPSAAEQEELLRIAAAKIPGTQLWVNPDCGLKTRGYEETMASLHGLVAAAHALRREHESAANA